MVVLWLTIPSMTYYPNPPIPGVVVNFKQHTVNLLSVTLLWGMALMVHFGLYQISQTAQTSREKMKRQQRDIKAHEEPYETPGHLLLNEGNEAVCDLDREESATRTIRGEKAL